MQPSDRVTVWSSDLFTWRVTVNGRDTYELTNTTQRDSCWIQMGRGGGWEVVEDPIKCAILQTLVNMHEALQALLGV